MKHALWFFFAFTFLFASAAFSATTARDCRRNCGDDDACKQCCRDAVETCRNDCKAAEKQCIERAPSTCKSIQTEMDQIDADCKRICRGKPAQPMSDCENCQIRLAYKKRDFENCVRAATKSCEEETKKCSGACMQPDRTFDTECVSSGVRKCPYDCQVWNSRTGKCMGPERNGCKR